MYKCMLCMICAEIFPLIRMLSKTCDIIVCIGPFHLFFAPPPPPIEGFCVYPYQKYLLLLKTPSEIKIKVPTHSPLGKKKEFKDTNIHAPQLRNYKFLKTPPLRFLSLSMGGGGADIKQILNGMVAHCVLFLL